MLSKAGIQGASRNPCDTSGAGAASVTMIRKDGIGEAGVAANHYVNQHQQRDGHQFRSTDRLLDSNPASPSIYGSGHHQWHLQQDVPLQHQHRQSLPSNPRPRESIDTATTQTSPAKYILRTLSSTPPEFFDHQHKQQHHEHQRRDLDGGNFGNRCAETSASAAAVVFNSGSLQRNRRSSASPSLISSLISSFTTSHHHLNRDRNHDHPNLNHEKASSGSCEYDDPVLSGGIRHHGLEMMERRGGPGNRVVTFDLPQSSSSLSSSSKSSLPYLDSRLHQGPGSGNPLPQPVLRRYSLSGGSLMPISSSTSCLISQSSLPSMDVIGSSASHHLLDRDHMTTAAAAGNYATLRPGGRKVTLTASPFHGNDPHHQRIPYHVDQERAFAVGDSGLCPVRGSISKVLTDQHFVQRSGSFVQENRHPVMMHQQRKLITHSDPHNQILLSNKTMMITTSSSPGRCNLSAVGGLPFYGSSRKAPECTQYMGANGLLVYPGVSPSSSASAGAFGTPIPAGSPSSSDAPTVMLHATHNGTAVASRQHQNRIKYSPDEGLGDERSEFGGGGDESVATSGINAITA